MSLGNIYSTVYMMQKSNLVGQTVLKIKTVNEKT